MRIETEGAYRATDVHGGIAIACPQQAPRLASDRSGYFWSTCCGPGRLSAGERCTCVLILTSLLFHIVALCWEYRSMLLKTVALLTK
jgi:hypothetical protein